MLDSVLDWSVVALPTVLSVIGVLVSIKVPHAHHHRRWYVALVLAGLLISGMTMWQQYRARASRESEVSGLTTHLNKLRDQLVNLEQQTATEVARRQASEKTLQEQTAAMTQSQQAEVVRRQQAERDLQSLIGAVGNRTRQGVLSDIKNSPIRVEINGRPTRDPAEITRVREALGGLMRGGALLRSRCRTDPPTSQLEQDADSWYQEAQVYLQKNLDSSFHTQFVTDKVTALIPGGVPEKRVNLWSALDQRIETLSKFIDQLK